MSSLLLFHLYTSTHTHASPTLKCFGYYKRGRALCWTFAFMPEKPVVMQQKKSLCITPLPVSNSKTRHPTLPGNTPMSFFLNLLKIQPCTTAREPARHIFQRSSYHNDCSTQFLIKHHQSYHWSVQFMCW